MTSGGAFSFGQSQPSLATTGQTAAPFGQSTGAFGQTSQQTTQPFSFSGASTPGLNPSTTPFQSFQPFTSAAATTSGATFPSFGSTPSQFTFPSVTTTAGQNTAFNFAGLGQQTQQPSLGSSLFSTTTARPQQSYSFMGAPLGQTSQQPMGQMAATGQTPQPNVNIFAPKIYNDERDDTIAQFNRVQAFWGSGKAYCSAFLPPYEISQTDPTHRFKSIGYSEYKKTDSNDSSDNKIAFLVKMLSNESQLKTSLLTYEQSLKSIIGSNMTIKLEITKVMPENRAVLSLTVTDPTTNKPLTCLQLQNFFSQPNIKNQLNNVFMNAFVNTLPMARLTKQELEEYLNSPPKGIDERLWAQAKHENPDANRFIPVPLVGFAALNERFKLQERETEQHKMRLKLITDDVSGLERHVMQTKSKLDECRRKHIALSNRVLKIMISQEVLRKRGYPIQAEEDQLKAKLEAIQGELSAPTKFQGCLNELMSQLRQLQSQHQPGVCVSLDSGLSGELKTFLKQEQDGITHLIDILKQDMKEIESIKCDKQSANV